MSDKLEGDQYLKTSEAPPTTEANSIVAPLALGSPGRVLAIVCVGIVLSSLDMFIVNVGLPAIAHDFGGTTLQDLSWVLNGYAVAYAALLVFFGRLAERFRRDRSFILGVAVFTAASGACAISNSIGTLVTFRVVQAAGAALMTPTSIGLLLASFPPDRRGGAVRIWSSMGGFAAALGPVVGGMLITVNWRWIFIINVPIGLAAMAVGWRYLPEVPGHHVNRPSLWGASLVTGGVATLIFAIIKLNDWGWQSIGVKLSFAASLIVLTLFVKHCLSSINPFVEPALFRIREFTGTTLVMLPYSVAFGAMLFSIALWDQAIWGWSALQTGLAVAPGPLLVPITAQLAGGRLIAWFGASAVISTGIILFTAGLSFWATFLGPHPSAVLVVVGMLPIGVGVGLVSPTLMGIGTSLLPPSSFATGAAVLSMINQAAMAIGVAVFVAVLASPVLPTGDASAFYRGWWIIAAISALGLIPTLWFIRPTRASRANGAK